METLTTWQETLTASWIQVWSSFLGILPKIAGAIVVFALGILLAYWIKHLIVSFLRLVKLDKLSKVAGIDGYLKKAEIKLDFVGLLGTFIEWIIIIIFFIAVVDILGLGVVSQVLTSVLGYLPNVFAAALIFAGGYIVAGVADGIVRGALVSVDHDIAKPAGKLARWAILITTFFAAVDQLKIAQGFIGTFFQGLTYTLALIFGLSIGLGAKDVVSKVLNSWYEKIRR